MSQQPDLVILVTSDHADSETPLSSPPQRDPQIFRYSASGNAVNVSVEMFPSAPADNVNFAQASALGNSEIRRAS